jgi:hypothetical protein
MSIPAALKPSPTHPNAMSEFLAGVEGALSTNTSTTSYKNVLSRITSNFPLLKEAGAFSTIIASCYKIEKYAKRTSPVNHFSLSYLSDEDIYVLRRLPSYGSFNNNGELRFNSNNEVILNTMQEFDDTLSLSNKAA